MEIQTAALWNGAGADAETAAKINLHSSTETVFLSQQVSKQTNILYNRQENSKELLQFDQKSQSFM